ncbi:hypothetical protein BGZ57DRAFT_917008, partial [Hyaloscypha finlandica]
HSTAFTIHSADDPGPYGQFSDPPSRPPSRTSNNKSPIRKIIDLTAQHATADPRILMSIQDQHDREMEQALFLSRQEYSLPPEWSRVPPRSRSRAGTVPEKDTNGLEREARNRDRLLKGAKRRRAGKGARRKRGREEYEEVGGLSAHEYYRNKRR